MLVERDRQEGGSSVSRQWLERDPLYQLGAVQVLDPFGQRMLPWHLDIPVRAQQ